MAKIVIVDDQEIFLEKIGLTATQYFKEKGIPLDIVCYDKPQLLVYDIVEKRGYDIYILDIEMPEFNGIELAKQIKKSNMEALVVFVTSHLEFSLEAFDVNAYQYILKHQIESKLPVVLEQAYHVISKVEKYYLISTNSRYEKVYLKDILCIYKERKNVVFIKANNEDTYVRETIQNVFSELNSSEFIYIDRGVIVNIVHVMKIYKNELHLRNNQKLLVSKSNIGNVKEKVHQYWKENIQ